MVDTSTGALFPVFRSQDQVSLLAPTKLAVPVDTFTFTNMSICREQCKVLDPSSDWKNFFVYCLTVLHFLFKNLSPILYENCNNLQMRIAW